MRKLSWLISILYIISLPAMGCSAAPTNNKPTETSSLLSLDKELSTFLDFLIENGKVYIRCELTIKNKIDSPLSFFITGDFSRDKQGGLLAEDTLYAYDYSTNDKLFQIEANGMLELVMVNFVGDYGGTNQKHDRLLPDNIRFEIQDNK